MPNSSCSFENMPDQNWETAIGVCLLQNKIRLAWRLFVHATVLSKTPCSENTLRALLAGIDRVASTAFQWLPLKEDAVTVITEEQLTLGVPNQLEGLLRQFVKQRTCGLYTLDVNGTRIYRLYRQFGENQSRQADATHSVQIYPKPVPYSHA